MKFEVSTKADKTVPEVLCYVALGSNMGDSRAYLQQAIDDLVAHQNIHNLNVSLFYQSKPHGPQDQPDYLNAAVAFYTELTPEPLLDLLQKIENDNDRVREGVVRWGARTLDLDLLFYADQAIKTKRLIVPHPRICERFSMQIKPLKPNVLSSHIREYVSALLYYFLYVIYSVLKPLQA